MFISILIKWTKIKINHFFYLFLFLGVIRFLFWVFIMYYVVPYHGLHLCGGTGGGSGGSNGLNRLSEVGAHESLEVEVGKLLRSSKIEQRAELLVGVDNATIGRVLEIVFANVRVNIVGHCSSRHLCSSLAAKEIGKCVTDKSGLHEAAGSTVARLALSSR